MKLLKAEDNPQMRVMIRDFVSDLAGAVTECSDGDEAVAAYTTEKFTSNDRAII